MPTYEGLRLKVLKIWRKGLANYRKRELIKTDFTIISNNCWGGMIYESYNLPKNSPTVGLFFMAEDYIKFLSDLQGYINGKLIFINPKLSKWRNNEQIKSDKKFGSYPVGVLSNGKNEIEIFFLHYHTEKEAKEKWERRKKRINWNKLLIKFNDQNGCSKKEIEKFMKLPFKNKIFFTCKHWENEDERYIFIYQIFEKRNVLASYEPFGKNKTLNITSLLNKLENN